MNSNLNEYETESDSENNIDEYSRGKNYKEYEENDDVQKFDPNIDISSTNICQRGPPLSVKKCQPRPCLFSPPLLFSPHPLRELISPHEVSFSPPTSFFPINPPRKIFSPFKYLNTSLGNTITLNKHENFSSIENNVNTQNNTQLEMKNLKSLILPLHNDRLNKNSGPLNYEQIELLTSLKNTNDSLENKLVNSIQLNKCSQYIDSNTLLDSKSDVNTSSHVASTNNNSKFNIIKNISVTNNNQITYDKSFPMNNFHIANPSLNQLPNTSNDLSYRNESANFPVISHSTSQGIFYDSIDDPNKINAAKKLERKSFTINEQIFEMVQRRHEFIQKQLSQKQVGNPVVFDAQKKVEGTVRRKRPIIATRLSDLKLMQLRLECKKRGIASNGSKTTLASRLQAHATEILEALARINESGRKHKRKRSDNPESEYNEDLKSTIGNQNKQSSDQMVALLNLLCILGRFVAPASATNRFPLTSQALKVLSLLLKNKQLGGIASALNVNNDGKDLLNYDLSSQDEYIKNLDNHEQIYSNINNCNNENNCNNLKFNIQNLTRKTNANENNFTVNILNNLGKSNSNNNNNINNSDAISTSNSLLVNNLNDNMGNEIANTKIKHVNESIAFRTKEKNLMFNSSNDKNINYNNIKNFDNPVKIEVSPLVDYEEEQLNDFKTENNSFSLIENAKISNSAPINRNIFKSSDEYLTNVSKSSLDLTLIQELIRFNNSKLNTLPLKSNYTKINSDNLLNNDLQNILKSRMESLATQLNGQNNKSDKMSFEIKSDNNISPNINFNDTLNHIPNLQDIQQKISNRLVSFIPNNLDADNKFHGQFNKLNTNCCANLNSLPICSSSNLKPNSIAPVQNSNIGLTSNLNNNNLFLNLSSSCIMNNKHNASLESVIDSRELSEVGSMSEDLCSPEQDLNNADENNEYDFDDQINQENCTFMTNFDNLKHYHFVNNPSHPDTKCKLNTIQNNQINTCVQPEGNYSNLKFNFTTGINQIDQLYKSFLNNDYNPDKSSFKQEMNFDNQSAIREAFQMPHPVINSAGLSMFIINLIKRQNELDQELNQVSLSLSRSRSLALAAWAPSDQSKTYPVNQIADESVYFNLNNNHEDTSNHLDNQTGSNVKLNKNENGHLNFTEESNISSESSNHLHTLLQFKNLNEQILKNNNSKSLNTNDAFVDLPKDSFENNLINFDEQLSTNLPLINQLQNISKYLIGRLYQTCDPISQLNLNLNYLRNAIGLLGSTSLNQNISNIPLLTNQKSCLPTYEDIIHWQTGVRMGSPPCPDTPSSSGVSSTPATISSPEPSPLICENDNILQVLNSVISNDDLFLDFEQQDWSTCDQSPFANSNFEFFDQPEFSIQNSDQSELSIQNSDYSEFSNNNSEYNINNEADFGSTSLNKIGSPKFDPCLAPCLDLDPFESLNNLIDF